MLKILMVAAILVGASPVQAATVEGTETYDLLFRAGTLNDIGEETNLVYQREVENTLKPETAERDTGLIAMSFGHGDGKMTKIQFRQDSKHRSLGQFPTSVGNPMIMVFYESVIRDMAESAGGSPFYIRNRVKDALIQPSEVEEGEMILDGETIATQTIRLHPFAEDPNRDQMKGFGDLELTVTMSADVPGWYLSLVADTSGSDGAAPVYRSSIAFDRLEAAQ